MDSKAVPFKLLASLGLLLLTADFWSPLLHTLIEYDRVFPLTMHTVMESFAIVVSMLVFAVSWHTYTPERAGNIAIIACGFLCVGLLDFAHMLSYKGMPDFITPASPQKAIVFWLSARWIDFLTLLVVALHPWRPFANTRMRYYLLGSSLSLTALIYYLSLWEPGIWPLMFVEGEGLTPLKIGLEYTLVVALLLPALIFYRHINERSSVNIAYLLTATLVTILSELCFTLYANVNDVYSLLGHSYKIIAYYFIYRAIFISSVHEPYERLKTEMAERMSAERTAEYLAFHDPLTGLPNRSLLQDRCMQALANARRNEKRCAIVFADIDNFKSINDSLGHGLGDVLLKTTAQRLGLCLRSTDTLGRYSGDEFVLILTELDDTDAAIPVLEKLLEQVQGPCNLEGTEVSITISLGLVIFPDDGDTFELLLKKAETAMFQGKAAGGNTYRYFEDAMNTATTEYLSIRNGLKKGLERKEFELYYQPQVSLDQNRIVGVEALVRWHHPEWGMVSPARFIPIAEESGLILPLSNWILDEACRQAVAWQKAGLPQLRMAVNLSALQFQRDRLDERVLASLKTSGLAPELLELELTESMLMHDSASVLATVQRLKSHGIRIAVDDFGTGYSSLSYLKQFAVDVLKIDQCFINNIASSEDDLAIVNAVIQMGHSLGLSIIAEGVETEAACELLDRYGCNEGQGYLFGKPMSADTFMRYMLDGQTRATA